MAEILLKGHFSDVSTNGADRWPLTASLSKARLPAYESPSTVISRRGLSKFSPKRRITQGKYREKQTRVWSLYFGRSDTVMVI